MSTDRQKDYERVLNEVLDFLTSMGVQQGKGVDGKLMQKIYDLLAEAQGLQPTRITVALPKGACPVCGARSMLDCDCDPMEQIKAAQ